MMMIWIAAAALLCAVGAFPAQAQRYPSKTITIVVPAAPGGVSDVMGRLIAQPDLREKFAQLGADTVGSSPEEFGALIKADIAKWAKVIKDAGIKAGD